MNVSVGGRLGGTVKKTIKLSTTSLNRNTDQQWSIIAGGIKEIYFKNASHLSFEELYRNAYNMCLQRCGDRLYNSTRDLIVTHLTLIVEERIVPVLPSSKTPSQMDAQPLLATLRSVWDDHTVCIGMIRDILMYLDRTYVKNANLPQTYDMGLNVFRDVVLHSQTYPVLSSLVCTLLHQVSLERNGEIIDRMLMKGIIDMFFALPPTQPRSTDSLYHEDWEPSFLDESDRFYERLGQRMTIQLSVSEYLERTEKLLEEEEQRTHHYLVNTGPKLRAVVEKQLIELHVNHLTETETGFIYIITNDNYDQLSRLYRLLGRTPVGHVKLRSVLYDYIKNAVKSINDTYSPSSTHNDPDQASGDGEKRPSLASSPIEWVDGLISLKDRLDAMLASCFCKDKTFETSINEGIQHALNKNLKSPEFLSLYLDENLRKGVKGKTDAEIEVLLDKAISIFRFVNEKDVFERYFKQHLAKRLLYGRSATEDTEKNVIAKLKVECGYQFTTKLEGMFRDMTVSKDLSDAFRSIGSSNDMNKIDVHVNVLTSTFWPITSLTNNECFLPHQVQQLASRFERFYLSRHSGRRLTWLRHMGTADLRVKFQKDVKELNVSTFAMIVLLTSFNRDDASANDVDGVPFQDILKQTGIPESDLKRTMQSLSLGKHRILLKQRNTKDVQLNEVFRFNNGFTSPHLKIKIQQVAAASNAKASGLTTSSHTGNTLETEEERKETLERINEHRKHQIEAVIVRIMKSRKSMRHNELVAEVLQQLSLRFRADPGTVKKRIEGLIEREYLERDCDDRQVYRYLA